MAAGDLLTGGSGGGAGRGRPATDWPAPRQVPTGYPGAAPDHHYLLIDDRVVPVRVALDPSRPGVSLAVTLADGTPVDDVLAGAGLARLAERVPMLAYGANRSPHSLALKLAHHGYRTPGTVVAVPVLAGTLRDVDVVASGLSHQGFVYADLVASPGTEVWVSLTLLDQGQAAAIHDSEGVGRGVYECAWVPGFRVKDLDGSIDVVAYAGCRPVFVSPVTGTPLAFSAIAASGRRFPAYRQDEVLAHVLAATGITGTVAALVGRGGRSAGQRDAAVDGPEPSGVTGVARVTAVAGLAGVAGLTPVAGVSASQQQPGPQDVARDLARLLNGQWWYVHNTGDVAMAAATHAWEVVTAALGRHGAAASTADRLAAAGAVIDAEAAFAAGPTLHLGAQIGLA